LHGTPLERCGRDSPSTGCSGPEHMGGWQGLLF
jgi:hypothetical protein